MPHLHSLLIAVLVLELIPAALFGLAGSWTTEAIQKLARPVRIILPAIAVLPYLLVSLLTQMFHWKWLALYATLPIAISWLLEQAVKADPAQRGNWRDALVLLTLGLAVDLRWFEAAWPGGWASLGKVLLVDMALYGFAGIRQLTGTGYDLYVRGRDWKTGLRELAFVAPFLIGLGLALGFLHPHVSALRPLGFLQLHISGRWPVMILTGIIAWIHVFLFIALPEELYFRAWVQNLLQRRLGRNTALVVASVIFGLSHFNKRTAGPFNWRYVLLATIAGIFYGRAWRQEPHVPASTITHATVDTVWGIWF